MKTSTRFLVVLFAATYLSVLVASSQNLTIATNSYNSTDITTAVAPTEPDASAEFPQPVLIGFYNPEGKFRSLTGPHAADVMERDELGPNQSVVPASLGLRSDERVVENVAPPGRAKQKPRRLSLLASLRDNLIAIAYGHAKVLQNPTHVTTDSQGRVIVSDPEASAVHVLDPDGKKSFRILGGPGRRLQTPGSIAVDRDDNIYVADLKLNLISVYNPAGQFLQYFGTINGEAQFEIPGAIAIDRRAQRLYVVDTVGDELVAFDTRGSVLRRAGNHHTSGNLRLKHPSQVALWADQIFVLDQFGTRVQVLDSNLQQVRSFGVADDNEAAVSREIGMALDQRGNVYLSNLRSSSVRVYSHDGRFLASVADYRQIQSYSIPMGIWVDSGNRLFICDSTHGRVQIFQIGSTEAPLSAVR